MLVNIFVYIFLGSRSAKKFDKTAWQGLLLQ